MLVLTRKLGEIIRVGDAVKITILEIRSGQVKLGIEAPPEIKVHREEVYARIQENRRAGRKSSAGPDQPSTARPDDTTRGPLFLRLIKGRKTKPA
ncbi:MAG: carbon storage regulator CsrA [Patescibacteria group bacterium]